jgi:hypothetical protein
MLRMVPEQALHRLPGLFATSRRLRLPGYVYRDPGRVPQGGERREERMVCHPGAALIAHVRSRRPGGADRPGSHPGLVAADRRTITAIAAVDAPESSEGCKLHEDRLLCRRRRPWPGRMLQTRGLSPPLQQSTPAPHSRAANSMTEAGIVPGLGRTAPADIASSAEGMVGSQGRTAVREPCCSISALITGARGTAPRSPDGPPHPS